MIGMELREPVSALTHGLGGLLAVLGTAMLWRRGGREVGRRASLVIFGAALVACYACSFRYHAAIAPTAELQRLRRLDHIGIFGLIAGTYTPVAWNLLRGRWRSGSLACAWTAAALGSMVLLFRGPLPPWLATAVYLALGWGALVLCREIARRLPPRLLLPMVYGGAFYSLGAAINLLGWPEPWPGVVGPHELFHLFVLAGSGCHYAFVLQVAARPLPPPGAATGLPDGTRAEGPRPPRPMFARRRPGPAHAASGRPEAG